MLLWREARIQLISVFGLILPKAALLLPQDYFVMEHGDNPISISRYLCLVHKKSDPKWLARGFSSKMQKPTETDKLLEQPIISQGWPGKVKQQPKDYHHVPSCGTFHLSKTAVK